MLSAFCGSPAVATLTITVCPPSGTIIRILEPSSLLPPKDFVITYTVPISGSGNIIDIPIIDPSASLSSIAVKIGEGFRPYFPNPKVILPSTPLDVPKVILTQPHPGSTGNVSVTVIPPLTSDTSGPNPGVIPTNFTGGENGFPPPPPPGTPKVPLPPDDDGPPHLPKRKIIDNPPPNIRIKEQEHLREVNNNYKAWLDERKKFKELQKTLNSKECTPIKANKKRRLMAGLNGMLCACPCCSPLNEVLDIITGKDFFKLPFSEFKIPRLDHLFDKSATFDKNRREGEKCNACDGEKKIPDLNSESAKYSKVEKKMKEKAPELLETESKLGLGGTRTTMVQGSDVLFVGMGMNKNKAQEVVADGSFAPTLKGGKIPQQGATKVNEVVGKQTEIGWPQQMGNYTIKCANKFSMLAGSGGITLATSGPLTISSSGLKLLGPQLSLGCAQGPLHLHGDSVSIAGNTISFTPEKGETFFKGNISNTGNMTCAGTAHFETASIVKLACVGTNKKTSEASSNPEVVNTERATWGKQALKTALLDIKASAQAVQTDPTTSGFKLASPNENAARANRLQSAMALAKPYESEVTGYIIPGTKLKAVGFINGAPATIDVTITENVDLHNIPHVHGLPEMKHYHNVQMPDIDFSSENSQALRDKVLTGNHESGAPQQPIKDKAKRIEEAKSNAVALVSQKAVSVTTKLAQVAKMAVPPMPKIPSMSDVASGIKNLIA